MLSSEEDQNNIYEFGRNLGIAFQLQDDYLDAFGNPETFGKQVGGDIIENKKTYLYIKALEFSNEDNKAKLSELFSKTLDDNEQKIETVKAIFFESKSANETKKAIEEFTNKAFSVLDAMSISENKKALLKAFGSNLMNRSV